MKKSSLKNYITLLEAAADSATYARDYWMREYERRVKELLEADNEIAELKADAAANASDCWARQHELKRRLDEAENEIAELERRLADNGGLCTLRTKLTTETCQEALTRLQEKNKIAELKADAAANSRDYWMREHDLRDEELLEADNLIAKLERRLERELIQQPAQFRAHILLKGETNVQQGRQAEA